MKLIWKYYEKQEAKIDKAFKEKIMKEYEVEWIYWLGTLDSILEADVSEGMDRISIGGIEILIC